MCIYSPIAANILALVESMETYSIAIVIRLEVGVDHPSLRVLMVSSIHQLQDLLTNKLVITIKDHLNIVKVTESESSVYDSISCKFPVYIFYIFDPALWELGFLEHLSYFLQCSIV